MPVSLRILAMDMAVVSGLLVPGVVLNRGVGRVQPFIGMVEPAPPPSAVATVSDEQQAGTDAVITGGVETPSRRGTDVSPAADRVHELGPLAGTNNMPLAYSVGDAELERAHSFSRDASWLIPGYVLCGSYPGASPGRPSDGGLLAEVRAAGVDTFVCLQEELPPQDSPWPAEGVPNLSDRAKWAVGNFGNYRDAAGPGASYVHFGLPDLSVAESLDALDDIVSDLRRRVEAGDRLYLHCWGGRGRTGLIAACLLGALYGDMGAEEALERVQCYYDLRTPLNRDSCGSARKLSPETKEQKNQVRDWYSFKRIIAHASVAPTSIAATFSIRARDSDDVIEEVGPSAIHPLTRADALERLKDAEILGKGQFGKVFRGRADEHGIDVAIKVMPDGAPSHEQSRLALEAKVLRAMSGKRGFPQLLYGARQTVFGRPSDVLVMSLLGKPVESLLVGADAEERSARVLKIGRDTIECLRSLHESGFVHNDIKPLNILLGPPGSDRAGDAHLLDFGSASAPSTGRLKDSVPLGTSRNELAAGGGTPLFASVAQLEGRPTSPVDDIESLWYCLAFLEQGALPWQWEPKGRVSSIKKKLFVEECGIVDDECDAMLKTDDMCSTAHCKATYDDWDSSAELSELWSYVLEAQDGAPLDYDSCILALGGEEEETLP